jgi:hypothetical protein
VRVRPRPIIAFSNAQRGWAEAELAEEMPAPSVGLAMAMGWTGGGAIFAAFTVENACGAQQPPHVK